MNRTRLAHLIIQPVLVIDDGEELAPGPQVDAASVSLSQLGDYIAMLREFVDQNNAQQTEPTS